VQWHVVKGGEGCDDSDISYGTGQSRLQGLAFCAEDKVHGATGPGWLTDQIGDEQEDVLLLIDIIFHSPLDLFCRAVWWACMAIFLQHPIAPRHGWPSMPRRSGGEKFLGKRIGADDGGMKESREVLLDQGNESR
jgi:hypothetical protein